MNNIHLVGLGDIVKYVRLDGGIELYKVTSDIEFRVDGYHFEVTIINNFGTLGNKKFTTTMTRKDGGQRIFRLWIQVDDKVFMSDIKTEGRVSSIYKDSDTQQIIVEVQSIDSKQFLYTLGYTTQRLSLLPI